jgi:hypothetical protein
MAGPARSAAGSPYRRRGAGRQAQKKEGNTSRWDAGMALMRTGNPDGWAQLCASAATMERVGLTLRILFGGFNLIQARRAWDSDGLIAITPGLM